MKIFHRDLKSANVFLSKDGQAKLGDLNVSKVAKKGLLYTQTGTPYYASPEVWRDQPYDNKSDIWSLGCVLYEMTTLKPPFRANDMNGLFKRVLKGVYPKIPATYSPELNAMIKQLLQVESAIRPTCDQIMAMEQVKKRLGTTKNLPMDNTGDLYEQMNLLNTIKLPKNLANITKDLPKSNYISKRIDSASIGPPPSSVGSKLIQSHPNNPMRLQSEPAIPNSRQLPSIYQLKDVHRPAPMPALSDGDISKLSSDSVVIKPPRRITKPPLVESPTTRQLEPIQEGDRYSSHVEASRQQSRSRRARPLIAGIHDSEFHSRKSSVLRPDAAVPMRIQEDAQNKLEEYYER